MTEVEAAVRQLGKAIQADPRYQAYWKAKTDNDADTELQENIQAFNLKKAGGKPESGKIGKTGTGDTGTLFADHGKPEHAGF